MISSDDSPRVFHVRGVEQISVESAVTEGMVRSQLVKQLADHIIKTGDPLFVIKHHPHHIEYHLDCVVLSWEEYQKIKMDAFEAGLNARTILNYGR